MVITGQNTKLNCKNIGSVGNEPPPQLIPLQLLITITIIFIESENITIKTLLLLQLVVIVSLTVIIIVRRKSSRRRMFFSPPFY